MPKLTVLSLSLLVASSSAFAPPAGSFCSSTKALSAATFTGSTQPRALQARSALLQRRAARLSMAAAQAEATKSAMTADGHTIGVVGATGAVGEEIVSVLHRRGFPVKELKLFSSARSAGKVISCFQLCCTVLVIGL
jgi:Semialdehyde dehydrogenase, NAD binding domain